MPKSVCIIDFDCNNNHCQQLEIRTHSNNGGIVVDVTCSISYIPEVHSVYVRVKSSESISASAFTPLSFILLSSATVGSAYTNMR